MLGPTFSICGIPQDRQEIARVAVPHLAVRHHALTGAASVCPASLPVSGINV